MAEGFKIADAYVSVVGGIDRAAVNRSSDQAGQEAGRVLGERISDSASRSLGRDSRSRFTGVGKDIGEGLAGAGSKAFIVSFGSGLSGLSTLASNPYVLAAGAGIGLTLAPAIMGAVSSALLGGAGLGVIGLGALLLKDEPALIKAATSLKDKTVSIFRQAAGPLLKPLVSALGIFEKTMVSLGPQITAMFAGVAPAIEPLARGISGFFTAAMPGLTELIKASGPFLVTIAPAFEKLGYAVGMFASMIADAGPEAAIFFNDLIIFVNGAIVSVGWLIKVFTQAYAPMRQFFVSIPGWISTAWSAISSMGSTIGNFFTNTVPGWFSGLWSTITGFVSGVASAIGGFFTSTLPGWISSAWGVISGFGSRIGGFFAALPGQIVGFLTSLPGRAVALFVSLFDMATFAIGYGIGTVIGFFMALPGRVMGFMSLVGSVVMTGVNAVVGFFTALPGRAIAAWNAFRTGATNAFNATKSAISNAISTGVNAVVGFFTALPGRAAGAVASLWSRISGSFTSARSQAQSQASSLVSGVVSFLVTLPGKAASAVSSVASRVASALRGAVSSARSIGADIISGMISGINSMIGAAVSAAKRAVGNIISGAKSALGINSPSKVAADEIGRWFLPGITGQIERDTPKARGVIAESVRSLVPPGGAAGTSGRPAAPAGGPTYHFAAGAFTLDVSKIKTVDDLIRLIDGLTRSARGFGAANGMGV